MSEKTERLLNLVIALKEVRRPVTLAWIRDAIHAYQQDDADTARRQFERDKDELRALGIPLETRETDLLGGELGYIIDERAYALPPVDLSGAEVAALSLALEITGEERARSGFAKLAARAPDPDASPGQPTARVTVGVDAIDELAAAMRLRRAVSFRYRSAGGEETERTIDAYAVAARRGHWYVVGRDHDRDGVRAFRLDRMASAVTSSGDAGSYEHPGDLSVDDHLAGPDRERVDVTIALSPRVVWEADARGAETVEQREDGWTVTRLVDALPTRTVSWVVGLGDEAELLAPPALRDRVAGQLRALTGDGP